MKLRQKTRAITKRRIKGAGNFPEFEVDVLIFMFQTISYIINGAVMSVKRAKPLLHKLYFLLEVIAKC